MECFLDTSAAIEMLRGSELSRQKGAGITRPLLSVVAYAELELGAARMPGVERFRRRLDVFFGTVRVVAATKGTACEYARIAACLADRGTPIPVNDMWIAAAALEHGLPLVARDAHFEKVPGLDLVAW